MYKLFSIILLGSAIISCSKSNSPAVNAQHQLTYKLTANNYEPLTSVLYVDTTGAPVQSSAVDSTNGWSKTYTITAPFAAQLSVQGINSTTATLNYILEIDEDGIVKSKLQDSVQKFNSFSKQINATIQ